MLRSDKVRDEKMFTPQELVTKAQQQSVGRVLYRFKNVYALRGDTIYFDIVPVVDSVCRIA